MNHNRWEYKVINLGIGWRMMGKGWIEQAAETLNREGAQGWELVSSQWMSTQFTLFFKRPR